MAPKIIFFSVSSAILAVLVVITVQFIRRTGDKEIEVSQTMKPVKTGNTKELSGLKNQSTIQYKKGKCLIINRFDCPSNWRPSTVRDCEEKLETCQDKYESLQKFCNPYCDEELESCYEELNSLKSYWLQDVIYIGPM